MQQRLLASRVVSMSQGSVRWRALVAVLMAIASVAGPGWEAGAQTGSHPLRPPHEPASNFRLVDVHRVLASIDAARRSQEGLAPLRFNLARFAHLSVSRQVFVISNLERTTRGLYPALAMTRRLDAIATAAARRDQDPTDRGRGYSSIWSSAPSSLGQYAFFADFGWMYDDGPPPQFIFRNVDCARAGASGCWGHRNNILSDPLKGWTGCPSELVTGTGFAPQTPDGPSLTQIFEVACSPLGSAAVFTWRDAVAYLGIAKSQSGLH
jgi:hypothetical protein